MIKEKPVCSICQREIQPDPNGWDGTNNAEPINEGRCCNDCNTNVVIPARIRLTFTLPGLN
jgi:hypothetical protein